MIIEFAGVKIKNVYDYTYVLQEHKPGDVVEITVLRNGQPVTLKALGQSLDYPGIINCSKAGR